LLLLQVVAMLALVVLLFAVCWGPALVQNLLTAWGHLHHLHHGYLKPLRQAFFLMSYFNSCINPIVYAFFSRNFRQSFKMAICACIKGKAFVRAYRYSVSAASSRASHYVHTNGRTLTSVYERDGVTMGGGSSGGDTDPGTSQPPKSIYTSPSATSPVPSPESVEMVKM
jgi:hypothetical protein